MERYQTLFFFVLFFILFYFVILFTRYDHDGFRRGKRAWRYRTWLLRLLTAMSKLRPTLFTVLGRDGIGLYFKHSTFLSIEFSSTDQ